MNTIVKSSSGRKSNSFRCLLFLGILCWLSLAMARTGYASPANNDKYYEILKSMKSDLSYARENYEKYTPDFDEYDREPEEPLREIETARYKKGKDGIYRADDKNITADGVAVINLTGDLMCQSGQQNAAKGTYGRYEFDDNFTYVKGILSSADFTVGNLETMLSENASYYCEQKKVEGRPQCNAPSTFLDAVRSAGYDMVVTANNHNCDTGVRGIFQTNAHLDQYQLIHTGTFTNKSQKRYTIVEIDGIKVGFLSYAKYYNTKDAGLTDTGKEVLLNRYSKAKVKKDVAAAKKAGAEYIICYIHWGQEFVNEQNSDQVACAKELANAGVDYIVGSHPHALQPYGYVKTDSGKKVPVIYSLGNFVSHMISRTCSRETIILQIKLKRNSSGKVVLKSDGYIPCRTIQSFNGNNYTTLPLTSPYNSGNITTLAKYAYPHITGVISSCLSVLGKFSFYNLDVKQSYTQAVYSGTAKIPKITVTDGVGNVLKKDVDYTVTRTNNYYVGVGTITVKGIKKYTGTWTGSVTIRPERITIKSLTALSQGFKVTYSRNTVQTTGYQIQCSTSRNFASPTWVTISNNTTTSRSVQNLRAGETYYVRVRCFKMVDGQKITSSWSAVKTITTEE